MFSRKEWFQVIGLLINLVFSGLIPLWLFFKGKKETKKLEERLEKEIIARKDLETERARENAEDYKFFYHSEKENRKKDKEAFEKAIESYKSSWKESTKKENKSIATIWRLRTQLEKEGQIPLILLYSN